MLIATVGIGGAALGVGLDADLQTGAATQENTLETAVSLKPNSVTATSGETTTYDVVVDTANGGVGAYNFIVSIADPSVASISDVTVGGNPSEQTTDVSIADDGASTDVTAVLADTNDTGSVTIATVTIQGDEGGTSDIGLTVDALGTESGESYTVTETAGASITVEAADEDSGPSIEPETAVRLQAQNMAISSSEMATFDVIVESADGGVGAYDFTVSLDEWSTASITDVSLQGNPSATTNDISIAEDGSSANVTAALVDTNDTGSVTIATVTVNPEDFGTTDMSLTVNALGTEAGESYVVTETTGATVEVINVDREPAVFAVSSLDAPASATQGDAIDVSADITNEADEDGATKQVEFRLDLDGDGTLDADETLASQELTLNNSETKTVTFSGIDTSSIAPGEYTHGIVTEDDAARATITIEAVDDGDDGDDGADDVDEKFTLDEISQAKYGQDFADLSTETAGEVQAIYNRQPFPEGTEPVDIRTRDEIANDRYDRDFDEVSRETTIEIQNDYDAQFGPLPSGPVFTLDKISQAKYGQDFADLSTETAGEVQAIYNRQPFPEGTEPADIRTRDEIANDRYDRDFDEVSRKTAIEIQNDYDAQFKPEN
ncbi:hypothetical protein [Halolamina sp.]|uniref:hypothetical protein n=1 Tax=Halolamina sp. TaxID=1940283 RepID=UPI00356985D0